MTSIYPHYQSPLAMIKEIAVNPETDYEFCGHALEEMENDGFDPLDIRNGLARATKATMQTHGTGVVRYLVEGKDTEGRRMAVVIEVEENPPEIFVITVWKVTKR